jgi:anti-anti-sigma regulatory factor
VLRVTVRENGSEQRWFLQGRLTDYFVAEVASNWQASRDQQSAEHRIVDLDGITIIDKSGEQVLTMMLLDGAVFVGLYTRPLLEALQTPKKDRAYLD